MPKFMIEGGVGMWFILLFGGGTLIGAVLFARRPDELRLSALKAISACTLLASLTGFVAGVAKTFEACARLPGDQRPLWPFFALKGVSESSTNLIFGFALLTLAWLVIAIGLRRQAVATGA